MDLLGLMHDAEPYGHLLVNGKAPNEQQIAAILGDNPRDVKKWLVELEEAGVFSRTEAGVIYSRRMVRDKAKADRDRENGKGGGNPNLKGEDKEGVNPPDKAHMPEARGQKLEEENYRFAGKVVKLNQRDYDTWKKTYCTIPDLDAELQRIDASLAEKSSSKGWFSAASAMLNHKHQTLLAAKKSTAKPSITPLGVGG